MKTRSYLLLMLVAIIVPVACLSIFGLSMLLRFEQESRFRTIGEIAKSTSLMIDGEVAAAEASLRAIAYSHDIRTGEFERLYAQLAATRSSPLTWTMVADYEGNGVINTLVPYGTPLARRTGDWAARIYDAQATQVGGYFIGARSRRGVVSVNVPVPAAAGKKYVVTQIFDPRYFDKVFGRNALPEGWIVGLFDADGTSVARNRAPQKLVGGKVRPELFDASRSARTGMLRHLTREGIEVYSTFVRSELTGWTVAVGVPVAEIEAAARMTTWLAVTSLLVVLGGAVGIAVFFGHRIDKSLRNATLAAHALALGRAVPATRSQLNEVNVLLQELQRSSQSLAQESAARQTLESERARLLHSERAARKQAEAQSAAKDNFISMLSHELRNPLAAISGALSVIRLPSMPVAKTDKAWEIATRQLRQLTRMVEDLLDVRRVLSGKVVLERTRLNVGAVVRFCCESRILAMATTHEWQIETADAWVLGDKTRLEQVLDNLLVNAVKYSPQGSTISVRNYAAEGMAVIEVVDRGVGMDADVLPTVFDSLVQGPTTIDRSLGGLGLGLSIAKGLVELHGGRITAHSEGVGKGSRFVVRLPLAGDAQAATPGAAVAATQAG